MDKIPDDILNTIYLYKHQLEFIYVMNELTQTRINCRYTFSLNFIKTSRYLDHDKVFRSVCDINNIHVESHEILDVLRNKKIYRLIN